MIKSICAISKGANKYIRGRKLTLNPRFYACELPPRTTFYHWTKEEKKALYFNKPVPKMKGNMYDTLYLPIRNKQHLLQFLKDLLNDDKSISMQNCGMLLYNLAKNNLLIDRAMKKLQKNVYKHKGEYDRRTTFGGLYAAISHNNKKMIDFFLNESEASQLKLLANQCFQLIIALNQNTTMTLSQKHAFWETRYKQTFMQTFPSTKQGKITKAFAIFDAFNEFQYYDQEIWDIILSFLNNKGGWIRTTIIEKLYPLSGILPRAKQIFDKYYIQLSKNSNIAWRYNLQELRLYSSEEMIAKSQDNIKLSRTNMSVWPGQKQAQKNNQAYLQYLEKGEVVGQQQIIRDKAQSFAYAIKSRYDALKLDGVDLSNLSTEEFEDLFGKYDEQFMKEKEPSQQPLKKLQDSNLQ